MTVRAAVVGKGGAGKSVIAGTLARLLARRGHRVLALDSDLMPGLALSLGAEQPVEPPLAAAAEQGDDGRWRFKPGIGAVRAVRRFSIPAPEGVLLLQCGKVGPDGLRAIMPALQAFYAVIHRLPKARAFDEWAVVGDLSAGPRQTAFDWAPYARTFVVVVEPSWKSILTARRVIRIARERGRTTCVVANKVQSKKDERFVARTLREPLVGSVPLSDEVRAAERLGAALVDHAPDSPAIRAISALADRLERPGSG